MLTSDRSPRKFMSYLQKVVPQWGLPGIQDGKKPPNKDRSIDI